MIFRNNACNSRTPDLHPGKTKITSGVVSSEFVHSAVFAQHRRKASDSMYFMDENNPYLDIVACNKCCHGGEKRFDEKHADSISGQTIPVIIFIGIKYDANTPEKSSIEEVDGNCPNSHYIGEPRLF
jgi:hypothetical protein